MSEIVLVRVTFADADEAARIARAMVEERLAACANIDPPCTSVFRWNDRIEHAEEVTAVFKTGVAGAERLVRRVAELHSYDAPVIERWPAAVDPATAEWIATATDA